MKTTFADMLENDEDVKNKLKAWLEDNLKGTYIKKSNSFFLFQFFPGYVNENIFTLLFEDELSFFLILH